MDSLDSSTGIEIAKLRRMFEFYKQAQADILKHRSDFAFETAQRVNMLEANFCRLLQVLRVLFELGDSQGWLNTGDVLQRLHTVADSAKDLHGSADFLQAFGFMMPGNRTSLYDTFSQLNCSAAATDELLSTPGLQEADPVSPSDFLKSLETD